MTTNPKIGLFRLHNQLIASAERRTPHEVVRRMGMLQAQDYLGALWAVGLRCQNGSEADIERALIERTIVRTWPARGTLHFVAAEDARWLLALLAPRAIAGAKSRHRQLGLDEDTFARSRKVFERALQGGSRLTREELYQALEAGGISAEGQRGYHILGRMALDGLVCFGPRRGKQHTFVQLEEWLPPAPVLAREEALAEIARRYFSSHGPATLQDFVWWTGLTRAEASAALDLARESLAPLEFEGQTYWQSRDQEEVVQVSDGAYLLPAFDEYLVGYKDRSAVLDSRFVKQYNAGGGMLNPAIVIDGIAAGTWKRTLGKGLVEVKPAWFSPPTHSQVEAFAAAVRLYGAFLGLPAVVI